MFLINTDFISTASFSGSLNWGYFVWAFFISPWSFIFAMTIWYDLLQTNEIIDYVYYNVKMKKSKQKDPIDMDMSVNRL